METDITPNEEKGEIVLYQPDDNVRLEVRLQDDTVWLTQQQMAELFNTTRNNITLHIGNIFKEEELEVNSVRKESLLTAADGKKYRTKFYNLDVIISVGYRVKSPEIRGWFFDPEEIEKNKNIENTFWCLWLLQSLCAKCYGFVCKNKLLRQSQPLSHNYRY